MDDLDRQLAELQLIAQKELQVNPKAEKKVAPAVPPKPKKNQVYANLSFHLDSSNETHQYQNLPKQKDTTSPEYVQFNAQNYPQNPKISYSESMYTSMSGVKKPILDNLEQKSGVYANQKSFEQFRPEFQLNESNYYDYTKSSKFNKNNYPLKVNSDFDKKGSNQQYKEVIKQDEKFGKISQLKQNIEESNAEIGDKPYYQHVYSNLLPRNFNDYSNIDYERNFPASSDSSCYDSFANANNELLLKYTGSSVSECGRVSQMDLKNTNDDISNYQDSASFYAQGSDCGSDIERDHRILNMPFRRNESSVSNYNNSWFNQNENYFNEDSKLYAPLKPRPPSLINDGKLDEPPLPPASPVSSSYSELRHATDGAVNQDPMFDSYTPASSTYESIYDPITPRPGSQQSSINPGHYSMYTNHPNHKVDVNELNNLLGDPDIEQIDEADDVYGTCAKCNQKIIGVDNGCTAMDQPYHIDCFRCFECNGNLQGKPFYNLEGKPYCEQDYLNTLEKCSVCHKPILDRILRATGRPYHPKCFTCIVCNKSLDGVPFTVDATNQIHCIEDFHKKFAPRCCVCKLPIMPENPDEETVRVVALDRSFHVGCYKCEDCGLLLSSDSEEKSCYPLDDHVLCKNCNVIRVQELTKHLTTEL